MNLSVGLSILVCLFVQQAAVAHEGHYDAFSKGNDSEFPQEIKVDQQGIKALGIKIARAASGSISEVLRATGEVKAAETNAYDITAPVSGAVRAVYVKQNDHVRK